MKTKYRIISITSSISPYERYLQFSTPKMKKVSWFWQPKMYVEVDVWRFIPKASRAKVLGEGLYQEWCSKRLNAFALEDLHVISAIKGWDSDLKAFVSEWPDIEEYFEYLRREREKYLIKKAAPADPVIYIN